MGYIIRDGVIYGGGSGEGDNIFHGTQAEWEQLSSAQKASYDFAAFTDDYDPTNISNPNLLDNPWFTVNQRGLSSYSTDNTYTVDRWKFTNTDNLGIVSINNGLTIDNTSGSASLYLMQTNTYNDNDTFKNILGKTVTLSILLSDGTILSGSGSVPSLPSTWDDIISIDIPGIGQISLLANDNRILVNITTYPTKILSIKAVKLEIGSVSTLAMDTAPNYAEELLKCQRYFVRMYGSNSSLVTGMCINGTTGANRFCIPLPVPTRTNKLVITVSSLSDFRVSSSDGARGLVPDSCSRIGDLSGIMQGIEFTKTGFSTGQVVILYSVNLTGYIDLSADL